MTIVVQKFGGTSLLTEDKRSMVINKVLQCRESGNSVVIVVSAIGRKGDPYSTDTLKGLFCTHYPGYSLRTLDLLMSCGEIISASILGAKLESLGEKVAVLTGPQAGILTDSVFGNAEILSIDVNQILSHLRDGCIVIVTGFQGSTKLGEITTLGRGGSDTTAAALGVALDAESVEIFTDVDGIMTADPSIVLTAKIIEEINYDEVFQMADQGAQIIHPRAVEIAKKSNLIIKVKNTMSSHPGTKIHYHKCTERELYSSQPSSHKLITAITSKDHISQISIFTADNSRDNGALLSVLAESNISVDMINFFTDRKIFTIDENQAVLAEGLLDKFNLKYSILNACSKITVIGNRITGVPGVMATIITTLAKENIDIFQSSDSHITISCLIKGNDTTKALNLLHDAFCLAN